LAALVVAPAGARALRPAPRHWLASDVAEAPESTTSAVGARRHWTFAVPVVAFVAIAAFLLVGLFREPQKIPSPLIDKPAPAFDLPLLPTREAGAEGRFLSSQLAGKPYLLNVWASWCAPCLQEHPLFVELAKHKLVPLIGIGYKDDPTAARNWLARHGNPYDVVAADRDGRVAIEWGVYGVPETFVVDATGKIRYKHIGPVTPEVMERQLLPLVRRLTADRGS